MYFLYITSPGYAIFPDVTDVKSLALGRLRALSETAVNPASLSSLDSAQVGMAVMNYFQIEELNSYTAYGLFPNSYLDAALRLSGFGYEDYRQWCIHGSFSKKINAKLSVGIGIHYDLTSGTYEEDIPTALGADIGLNYLLHSHLRCVVLYENVFNNSDAYPGLLSSGVEYKMAPSCYLSLEYATDFSGISRFSFGIDYELSDRFCVRTGCYTQEFTPTFGLSFSWNRFTTDIACDKHAQLGYSTSLALSYKLN